MRVLTGSTVYRFYINTIRAFRGSKIIKILGEATHHSFILGPFNRKNFDVDIISPEYQELLNRFPKKDEDKDDSFEKIMMELFQFDDHKTIEELTVMDKLKTIVFSSFFMKMLITWKDCEDNDRYS